MPLDTTILLMIQQTITSLYSNWYSKRPYYHTHWYNNPLRNSAPLLTMNKATARPLLENPRRCAHQERLGGRQTNYPRLWTLCNYIAFSVFAICVIRYPHRRRPISREDAHLMYPRFPRVLFVCYDLLPTPPPISVRKAGDITVVYLCGF